jgi:tetratricopeptide (TPR) repeat protein/GGDEF domain-containing protein
MASIEKLLEKAEKYLLRQKFENAFDAYLEVYHLEPRDEGVLLHLSDLALMLNRPPEALRFGSELADLYIKRNDVSRAVATCRKALKSSPQDVGILAKLAPLLDQAHKNNEALEAYRELLNSYLKSGQKAQSIDCLQHIVKLDPSNIEPNLQLAEMASQVGQPQVACPACLQAAELAKNEGQEERWAELVERAQALDPSNEEASLKAAQLLLSRHQAREALVLAEPIAEKRPEDLELAELLAGAYLASGEWAKAELLCLKLYKSRPGAILLLEKVAAGFLQSGDTARAMELVRQLRSQMTQEGKGKEFLSLVERVYQSDESNVEILELLASLYNEMNREEGLRRSLTRIFNLYLASEQYDKAADTLERIVDVDPYGAGHADRLLNLEGHIDPIWYRSINSRLQVPSSAAVGVRTAGSGGDGTVGTRTESLDDLLIEGEMYFQYQLSAKLTETLEQINQLYPGAHEKNSRLRDLYSAAGFHPTPAKATEAPGLAASAPAPAAASPQSFENLRKISDITANIYRESTLHGVLQVAVDQLGRTLNASRCWAGLGPPDRAPESSAEFCNLGIEPSEAIHSAKVFGYLLRQGASHPDGWAYHNVSIATDLSLVAADLQEQGAKSLLAVPLSDKDQPSGLLLVEQCDAQRFWTPEESILLKAVAPQIVIAANNTRLRRLVRSLAGTDPETGLLPRGSYIDCLLAEARRAKDQARPMSVCVLEPENPSALLKALGDTRMQAYVQQVSSAITSHLRQNDIAVRYSPCSIAVVFPDTALPQGGLAVEKLRRVLSQVKPDERNSPQLCAAICDVPLGQSFDPVDGVTEVINRLETSLEEVRKNGGRQVLLSHFEG